MLKLSERGDTIVEVLIVLSILGMAFSIAYATSNRSLQSARNAQEHSAALQYMSGQIEHMRADNSTQIFNNPGAPFCMSPSSGAYVANYTVASCNTGPPVRYLLKITQSTTEAGLFQVDVTWEGVGNLGAQKEQLFYRLHKQ